MKCPFEKGKPLKAMAPLHYKGGGIYTDVPGSRFKIKLKGDKKPTGQCNWKSCGHPADVWDDVLAMFD